jgi:hypothetical protein
VPRLLPAEATNISVDGDIDLAALWLDNTARRPTQFPAG